MTMASHGFGRTLRRPQRGVRDLMALINTWRQRARGRHELSMMNDRELRDLAINRSDVLHEARKPFWRA